MDVHIFLYSHKTFACVLFEFYYYTFFSYCWPFFFAFSYSDDKWRVCISDFFICFSILVFIFYFKRFTNFPIQWIVSKFGLNIFFSPTSIGLSFCLLAYFHLINKMYFTCERFYFGILAHIYFMWTRINLYVIRKIVSCDGFEDKSSLNWKRHENKSRPFLLLLQANDSF